MRLTVFSHKICWTDNASPSGYATDGGFPLQMQAISELFSETRIVVPCSGAAQTGVAALGGKNLKVSPLSVPRGAGWRRKLAMIGWTFKNAPIVWREARGADAIHAPIPGDIGTIGMLLAVVLRKPLFVRHCGNWFVQKTVAEHFWRWSIERLAGGRNVMLATGGADEAPSAKNPAVKWIFSTSLGAREIAAAQSARRRQTREIAPRLVIACRQEPKKGTNIVIESLPAIVQKFPRATLDVIGGGSQLEKLRAQAGALGVGERVAFHGKVAQPQVVELLRQADLFCYPTTASEGFPKVVLEALACGLPVLTTKVSVLPQLVKTGCGVLLDEPTAESLARAVIEVAADATLFERMSAAAVETAAQFTLERWRDCIGEDLRRAWNVESLSSNARAAR